MSEALIDRLCRQARLDRHELHFLRDFDDDELTRLVDAFERERDRRDQQLDRSIEDGLALVPRMLRRPVLKVIRGGGR